MADHADLIKSVVSGVLTGGASAATTFLAVFKDIKKRIGDLEAKLGSDTKDPKTGLFYTVEVLSDSVRRIRREIDSWRDDPPDWMVRAAQRRTSSFSMEHHHELEQRVEQRLRAFSQTLKRLEDDLDRREEALEEQIERSSPAKSAFISRAEYEEHAALRGAELKRIRDNLAATNSFLRGVMASLGYIDPEPTTPKVPMVGLPPPKRK